MKSTKKTKPVTVVDLLHQDNIRSFIQELQDNIMDIDGIVVIYEKHSQNRMLLHSSGLSNDYEEVGFLEWAKDAILHREVEE